MFGLLSCYIAKLGPVSLIVCIVNKNLNKNPDFCTLLFQVLSVIALNTITLEVLGSNVIWTYFCFSLLFACFSFFLSLSDKSRTPTLTHILFGFLNELIVVVDCSTCCMVYPLLLFDWLFTCSLTLCTPPTLTPPLIPLSLLVYIPSTMPSFFLAFILFILPHLVLLHPLFRPILLLLFLLFSSLSACMCFVPGSQWECVTAAALPVQADSDWFSGASSPWPHRAEGA